MFPLYFCLIYSCRSPNFSTLQHLPHIGSCVDLEIPFMSTINDFWEATYVYHREQHGSTPLEEEVDVQDGVSESNGETDEVGMVRTSVSAAVRRQSKAGRRESRKTAGDTQFKDAQVSFAFIIHCQQLLVVMNVMMLFVCRLLPVLSSACKTKVCQKKKYVRCCLMRQKVYHHLCPMKLNYHPL